jgi:hypothetical protein
VTRELTYQVPFERLRKLGRSSGRKAYPRLWAARWLVLGTFLAALMLVSVFGDALERWQASVGLPSLTVLLVIIAAGLIAIVALRRAALRATQSRADFHSEVRLARDDGGIRIATADIEYYLKWRGIAQILKEHDGVVVSHGNLFFLIPDSAFIDGNERNAFVRDVLGRLGEEAQKRSESSMRLLLDAASTPARS